ncbi:MAG: C69 family dipeptidase, partial [Synergistaceae bacterium]
MIKIICRQKALCAMLLFVFFLASNSSEACTVVMAGKKATATGDVILSYTCDGWYDHRLTVVPGKENPKGAVVQIYKNKYMETRPDNKLIEAGTIPEVKKTYSYFNTSYPIMNEKSVVIGEHTWGGRDESECPTAMMMIEQLEALGLQRGATARETLKIITDLAEKYGYGDRGEALAIADKDEIWLLEITGPGAFWKPKSGKPG